MSVHRSDNRNLRVNTTPLFASSWLALFSVLRNNFYEPRTITDLKPDLEVDLEVDLVPIESDNAEKAISD